MPKRKATQAPVAPKGKVGAKTWVELEFYEFLKQFFAEWIRAHRDSDQRVMTNLLNRITNLWFEKFGYNSKPDSKPLPPLPKPEKKTAAAKDNVSSAVDGNATTDENPVPAKDDDEEEEEEEEEEESDESVRKRKFTCRRTVCRV
jgi:hypothetical protein